MWVFPYPCGPKGRGVLPLRQGKKPERKKGPVLPAQGKAPSVLPLSRETGTEKEPLIQLPGKTGMAPPIQRLHEGMNQGGGMREHIVFVKKS